MAGALASDRQPAAGVGELNPVVLYDGEAPGLMLDEEGDIEHPGDSDYVPDEE